MRKTLMTMALMAATTGSADMMMTGVDKTFVTKAAHGNNFEIAAAKLALSKGMSAGVKSYAQKMITDHTKMGSQMKAAVGKSEPMVMVPAGVDAAQRQMLNQLQGSSGKAFDLKYKSMMVSSHAQTYKLFQGYAKNGRNDLVKAVVEGALPVVKGHLDMARMLPNMAM